MEGEGFEPSKAEPSDLQSDPFDRSGTPPNFPHRFLKHHNQGRVVLSSNAALALVARTSHDAFRKPKRIHLFPNLAPFFPDPSFQNGAATRSRTLDLLITSELLYQLSYGGQNGGGILKNEIRQRNHHDTVYLRFTEIRWSQRHVATGNATNRAILFKK